MADVAVHRPTGRPTRIRTFGLSVSLEAATGQAGFDGSFVGSAWIGSDIRKLICFAAI
jgi:uncharacterized protein involved in copper resistance